MTGVIGSVGRFKQGIDLANQQDIPEQENVIIALTDDEFNDLEEINFNELEGNQKCNICLEYFNEDSKIIKLKCGHVFDYNNIENWFYLNSQLIRHSRSVSLIIWVNFVTKRLTTSVKDTGNLTIRVIKHQLSDHTYHPFDGARWEAFRGY